MIPAIWAYWREGGWLLWPIAAVCFGIWAYVLRLHAWHDAAIRAARRTEQELDRHLRGDRLTLSHDKSFPAAIACASREHTAESADARRFFDEQAEIVLTRIRRDLIILRALVAAAPLLGLLGTVFGMVETFSAVSTQGADSAPAVARGVSAALITTQFGLVAALPGVFGIVHIHRMRRRLEQAVNSIGKLIYLTLSPATRTRAA